MRSDTETTTILDTAEGQAMSRILGSDAFYDANPHSYAGLVQRLQMLREGGLPPMQGLRARRAGRRAGTASQTARSGSRGRAR